MCLDCFAFIEDKCSENKKPEETINRDAGYQGIRCVSSRSKFLYNKIFIEKEPALKGGYWKAVPWLWGIENKTK